MSGFRAAHTLLYGFSGAAQFQIVAGDTTGTDPGLLAETRAAAAAAADDATATRFPAGRSGRRGRLSWFAVAVPTSAVEALSGRDGLAVSFVIVSRSLRLPPTDFFRDVLAALETGLRRAVPGARGLRDGTQLLASALQRDDGGDAVAGALAAYTDQVNHLLNAVAGTHRVAGPDGEGALGRIRCRTRCWRPWSKAPGRPGGRNGAWWRTSVIRSRSRPRRARTASPATW
ncbi:hypothetical protein [Micromonospora echinospora]|uniref:hypothetical protein n=1 Tax=Micromonospora echinospora TaxID=1877 RepID=UPI003A8482C5